MPTVDFTKEELLKDVRKLVRDEVQVVRGEVQDVRLEVKVLRNDMTSEIAGVKREITRVGEMLDDDARAEGRRLDRVDRRSLRASRLLAAHMKDAAMHGGGS